MYVHTKHSNFNKKSVLMVILPFRFVPHHVHFRYDKKWWIKRVGSSDMANEVDSKKYKSFNEETIVSMAQKDIENTLAYAHIIEKIPILLK